MYSKFINVLPGISHAEVQRSHRTSYQQRNGLSECERNELELNARAKSITQKYKR